MSRSRFVAPALAVLVAGCVAPSKPPPRPVAAAPPPPARVVPKTQAAGDWRDVPLTPGAWRYAPAGGGSVASYGPAGAPVFEMRCVTATHEIALVRPGAAGPLIIRTSYGVRTFVPRPAPDGTMAVTLPARDPALDQIAFSRGRFSVESAGAPTLFLPAWAEPSRVIEDCR